MANTGKVATGKTKFSTALADEAAGAHPAKSNRAKPLRLKVQSAKSRYPSYLERLLAHLYCTQDSPIAALYGDTNIFYNTAKKLRPVHAPMIVRQVFRFLRETLEGLRGVDAQATLSAKKVLGAVCLRMKLEGFGAEASDLQDMFSKAKTRAGLKKNPFCAKTTVGYPIRETHKELKSLTGYRRCGSDAPLAISVILLYFVTLIQEGISASSRDELFSKSGHLGQFNLSDIVLNPDCGYAAAVWKDATVWSTNHVRRNKKLTTKSTGRIMKAKEVRPHVTELAGCSVKLTKGTVDAFQIGAVGIVNGIMNELARSANPAKRKPDDVVSAARVVLGVDTYNRLMSPVPYHVRFTVKSPDGVPQHLPVGTPVYVPMGMDETDDQDPEAEAQEVEVA